MSLAEICFHNYPDSVLYREGVSADLPETVPTDGGLGGTEHSRHNQVLSPPPAPQPGLWIRICMDPH
jgi:hypothetical protein